METMYNAFWDHLKAQLSRVLQSPCGGVYFFIFYILPYFYDTPIFIHILTSLSSRNNMALLLLLIPVKPCVIIDQDEAVQKVESITDPVQLLRSIFHVLILVKMDMKVSFLDLLDYTTKWLTKAATDLIIPSTSSHGSSSSCSLACSPPSWVAKNSDVPNPTRVLLQSYMNLLWDPDNYEFPETLLMDKIWLWEMESQLHQLTILASVLLIARGFSGNYLLSFSEFVDKLKCITKALTEEFNS
ncbi:Hypothetical predicted protein, partial [Lynx pardinus]